ncbi:hypothetical protein [Bradyrhizobium liaoningense]
MLGDVANAKRTIQADNRDAKTIGVAKQAKNLRQLNRTFVLKVDRHSLASENISTGV